MRFHPVILHNISQKAKIRYNKSNNVSSSLTNKNIRWCDYPGNNLIESVSIEYDYEKTITDDIGNTAYRDKNGVIIYKDKSGNITNPFYQDDIYHYNEENNDNINFDENTAKLATYTIPVKDTYTSEYLKLWREFGK